MEESFLKMDIFFAVTTVITLVGGIMVLVLLYYLTKVVRDVSEITARVKKEAHEIVDDVREVRGDIKDGIASAKQYTKAVAGASIVRGVSSLLQSFVEEKENTTRRRRAKKKVSEE